MTKVKAPNGDIYDLPAAVASGLVNSPDSGWKAVKASKSAQASKTDDAASGAADSGAPKGNASREDWAAHAVELGIEVPADATRDDIKALVAAHNPE